MLLCGDGFGAFDGMRKMEINSSVQEKDVDILTGQSELRGFRQRKICIFVRRCACEPQEARLCYR